MLDDAGTGPAPGHRIGCRWLPAHTVGRNTGTGTPAAGTTSTIPGSRPPAVHVSERAVFAKAPTPSQQQTSKNYSRANAIKIKVYRIAFGVQAVLRPADPGIVRRCTKPGIDVGCPLALGSLALQPLDVGQADQDLVAAIFAGEFPDVEVRAIFADQLVTVPGQRELTDRMQGVPGLRSDNAISIQPVVLLECFDGFFSAAAKFSINNNDIRSIFQDLLNFSDIVRIVAAPDQPDSRCLSDDILQNDKAGPWIDAIHVQAAGKHISALKSALAGILMDVPSVWIIRLACASVMPCC